MTVKLSARLVHDYLAGRIDVSKFNHIAFRSGANIFDLKLANGCAIQKVSFESGGLDKDDDFLVFEFDSDWSVTVLKSDGDSPQDANTG